MRILLITLSLVIAMPVIAAYLGIIVGKWIKNRQEKRMRKVSYIAP